MSLSGRESELSSEVEWSTGAAGDAVELRGGMVNRRRQATQLTSEVKWSTGAAGDAVDLRGGMSVGQYFGEFSEG